MSSDSGSSAGSVGKPEVRASGRASSIDHGHSAHVGQSLRQSVASAVSALGERIEVGTVFGTALNTMCNVIGAGVLSLPLAFYRASLGYAIILTLVMAAVGIFSAYVLFVGCDRTGVFFLNECFAVAIVGKRRKVRALPPTIAVNRGVSSSGIPLLSESDAAANADNEEDATDYVDYMTTDEMVHEKKREWYRMVLSLMVDGCILVNNYLCLAVYCGIILDTVPSVLKQFAHADGIWVDKLTWMIIAGVVFFALTSVRNMEELKWTSLLGVVTIMWAIFAVIIEFARHGYQGTGERVVIDFEFKPSFAAAFGTLALAFGYHYNIPIFYHELQDRSPRKMMKTVAIAFPVITISYVVTGALGYLSFGQHVNDEHAHGVIINNYGTYNAMMNTVRLGLFFHFAAVYPVLGVCVRHSLHRFILTFLGRREDAIDKHMPAKVPRWAIISEAFVLVWSSSAIAYLYPNVGQLITIVGDLCSGTLMLTVPGVIGMCVWAPRPDLGDHHDGEHHGAYAAGDADGFEGPSHRNSSVGDRYYPPPHWRHRRLMFALCTALTAFGFVLTIISFYSTLMK